MVAESGLDVLHVRAAARQHDAAQQTVGIFAGHLVPHILYDFLYTSLNDFHELTALDRAVVIDRDAHRVVDVAVVGEGRAVFQFHLLGVALFHLQRCDVLGDIVAAKGNDSQVAQHVFEIDRDGGGVGTQVDEHASRALLGIGEHAVGQRQRCQIHVGDGYAGQVEALVEIAVEQLSPEDVQEVALQSGALNAHGVHLVLVVYLVFLRGSIQDFLVLVAHVAVAVHQFVHHFLRDDGVFGKVLHNVVPYTANRLSADTHIDIGYLRLERVGEFLHNVGNALCGFVDVVNHTFADEAARFFRDHCQHGDTAVEVLLSCNTCHLG